MQWTALRPADEQVRRTDDVAIVSVIRMFQPGKPVIRRVVITDASRVAPLVGAFNGLKVEPPGVAMNCFLLTNKAVAYRVAFTTSPAARADVVATLAPCSPVVVTVHGHRRARPQLLRRCTRTRRHGCVPSERPTSSFD